MNIRSSMTIAGMALVATAAVADEPASTTIDIAGHPVPVLKGGLYDRYRSNPPLLVVKPVEAVSGHLLLPEPDTYPAQAACHPRT